MAISIGFAVVVLLFGIAVVLTAMDNNRNDDGGEDLLRQVREIRQKHEEQHDE